MKRKSSFTVIEGKREQEQEKSPSLPMKIIQTILMIKVKDHQSDSVFLTGIFKK